jgi:hypothetical protein
MAGVVYGWGSGRLTRGWRRLATVGIEQAGHVRGRWRRGIRLASPRLVESEWHAAVMDRLDALRIKYARAQEHCAAWSRALDQWVATLPYGVRGEADPLGWFVV